MPKIKYIDRQFNSEKLDQIDQANEVIDEYEQQGFKLTLRQLFYQYVSRAWISNTERSYKNLGTLINNARMAGLIDWNAIEDRTRKIRKTSHWENPRDIITVASEQFALNKWECQGWYVECWIEKDALLGVIEGTCKELDIPYFSCRGYVSQSEMWRAAQRFLKYKDAVHYSMVIHLGDHDPSGIDMTRDIRDRLDKFMGGPGAGPSVKRIALNQDQIDLYKPPPNPTKITDSRAASYMKEYGDESWELDALEPSVMTKLVWDNVDPLIDWDAREIVVDQERDYLIELGQVADNWEKAVKATRRRK